MISTKGRYALRVLVDLAEQGEGARVPLKEIAKRQGISEKYLQHIVRTLVAEKLLEGTTGKGGGYRLTKRPDEYVGSDVLELVEGTIAPVACLARGAEPCERAATCKTLPIWKGFYECELAYFGSITVASLLEGQPVNAEASS